MAKRALARALQVAAFAGIDPHRTWLLRRLPRFWREARAYAKAAGSSRFPLDHGEIEPILYDYAADAGIASGHYFHQDLWAARKVFARRPAAHVDIGSRIDGFVAHLLSFMPVTIIDIRPLRSSVDGLTFVQGDACRLDNIASRSIDSLSSLHAVEHVGLGRYGDHIDPDGWLKALRELARVLGTGGRLYLGVPVGRERVCFNSERVFHPSTIIDAIPELRLVELQAVDDAGAHVVHTSISELARANYSCGLFEFTRD